MNIAKSAARGPIELDPGTPQPHVKTPWLAATLELFAQVGALGGSAKEIEAEYDRALRSMYPNGVFRLPAKDGAIVEAFEAAAHVKVVRGRLAERGIPTPSARKIAAQAEAAARDHVKELMAWAKPGQAVKITPETDNAKTLGRLRRAGVKDPHSALARRDIGPTGTIVAIKWKDTSDSPYAALDLVCRVKGGSGREAFFHAAELSPPVWPKMRRPKAL